MNKKFAYQLDTTSKKFKCPGCGQKRLVRYIEVETKDYLNEAAGRCDRESSCGYHLAPKEFFVKNPQESNRKLNQEGITLLPEMQCAKPVSYLPFEIMDASVTRYDRCNLYPFLIKKFRQSVADNLCKNYFIGANKDGNTVFWQVDIHGKVRYCKIMPYISDGHRDKEKVLKSWIDKTTGELMEIRGAYAPHKEILKDKNATCTQCFFGEYQLSYPENKNKPIAIVESEKTAVIASVYYPGFIWIATGGKDGCKWTEQNVCMVLRGRKVILFPDLDAYDSWTNKALLLADVAGCKVAVSNTLKQIATEKEMKAGYDIADYLLRNVDSSGLALTDDGYPVLWDHSFN